jgi:hypothetical protein
MLCVILWFYQPTFFVSKTKPTVAIIFGYNCFLKDDAYTKAYVRKIIPHLQGLNLQKVVVSGGVTRPTERPGESEAQAILTELLAQGVAAQIILEKEANSTVQNVLLTQSILQKEKIAQAQVLVFSSAYHRVKILGIELRYGIPSSERFHFAANPWRRN